MTTTGTKVPAIYSAIAAIQEGVGSIPKNGEMNFKSTRYNFVKADDIQEKIHELLVANSVIVKPEILEAFTEDRNMGGRTAPFVIVKLSLKYIATSDGSEHEAIVFGEATGTDDKSVRKAVTSAQKIANLLTFQISTGDPNDDTDTQPYIPPTETANASTVKIDKARSGPKTASTDLKAKRAEVKALIETSGKTAAEVNQLGQSIDPNWFESVESLDKVAQALLNA